MRKHVPYHKPEYKPIKRAGCVLGIYEIKVLAEFQATIQLKKNRLCSRHLLINQKFPAKYLAPTWCICLFVFHISNLSGPSISICPTFNIKVHKLSLKPRYVSSNKTKVLVYAFPTSITSSFWGILSILLTLCISHSGIIMSSFVWSNIYLGPIRSNPRGHQSNWNQLSSHRLGVHHFSNLQLVFPT